MTSLLKLRAEDAEDAAVVAAVLQDAIVPVRDMVWHAADTNFIMVVQRFCWDGCADRPDAGPSGGKGVTKAEGGCYERICCALDITGVEAVQSHGFDPADCSRILEILTVGVEAGWMQFIFAGDAHLRLKLASGEGGWRLRMEDFGAPWPTLHRPVHTPPT